MLSRHGQGANSALEFQVQELLRAAVGAVFAQLQELIRPFRGQFRENLGWNCPQVGKRARQTIAGIGVQFAGIGVQIAGIGVRPPMRHFQAQLG